MLGSRAVAMGLALLMSCACAAAAQEPMGRPAPDKPNSPGLRCWGIRGGPSARAFVFREPSTSSGRLGFLSSWVAVTGPARNGFLPVNRH